MIIRVVAKMMGEMLFWDIWNIAYRRKRGADLISKSM